MNISRKAFFQSVGAALASSGVAPAAVVETPIKPGELYIIECDQHLSQHAVQRIQRCLEPIKTKYGVDFLLLDESMRARRASDPSARDLAVALADELQRRGVEIKAPTAAPRPVGYPTRFGQCQHEPHLTRGPACKLCFPT